MSVQRVMYNGIEMAAEWPERIEAAQRIGAYAIGDASFDRIPYGKEQGGPLPEPCHDCGVMLGQYHVELICDMEECPRCGGQVIGCDCPYVGDDAEATHGSPEAGQSAASEVDWRKVLQRLGDDVAGFTVFLETPDGRFVPANGSQLTIAAAVAVAWVQDGCPAWETEGPARELVATLSNRTDLSGVMLLNRDPESFVGYYVRVTG